MACTDQKMSKQLTAGARKHRTLTVPQKLEIIRRTEYGKVQTEVIALYNIGSENIYDIKKWKNQL